MAEATDTTPPPPKLSRYRTLRGKNVPESRRYVAPPPPPPSDQEAAANHGHSHGSNALPPQRTTTVLPHASSEAPASSLTAPPQPPPSALPSGGKTGVTSPFRETHSGAVRPPVRGSPAHPPVSSLRSLESAASSADADGAAAFLAAPVDRRRQQRPPPLRPTLPDHSQQQSPLQETRREPDAAGPLLPTQILVPLPSARHGGQAIGGGVVASAETGLRSYAGGAGVLRHGASDEDVAQMDVDVERILAEQKRKDLERLQAQLANHQPAVSSPKSPAREKFAFLTRRRGLSSAVSSSSSSSPLTSPNLATTSPTEPLASKFASPANPVSLASKSSSAAPRPATGYANGAPNRTPSASDPPLPVAAPFEPKPAPFMDAPSSAPGGGASRQVSVRCRQFSAKITVFVDTTVADLLQSCADAFPCPIDAGTSALLESYTRLGLERRLRRYERVRDIMDSWDNEADNALVVLPAPDADSAGSSAVAEPVTRSKKGSKDAPNGTGSGIGIGRNGDANDLHVSSVSRSRSSPPSGFKFLQMYHSQKPGRWNKRFVTLVEGTGQVVATKKADESRLAFLFNSDGGGSGGGGGGGGSGGGGSSGVSSNANSDVQNLCHLSDYDIYTPTEAHMRKHLKPPKMFCFAIKSQQRTTVFVNTDNYVHFFSIEDPVQARMFYDRVFAWRSWYLFNQKLSVPLRGVAPAAAKKKQHQQHQHQQLVQAPQSQKATTMPPSSSSSVKQHALQRSYSRKSTTSGNAPVSRSANNPPNRISVAESLFGNVGNFDPTLSLGLYAKLEADRSQSAMKAGAPHTTNEKDGDTFASNGLLGSKYDERKKVEAEKQRETSQQVSATAVDSREAPFTSGSSLLSRNVAPSTATAAPAVPSGRQEPTTPWFPSASEHTARQRSRSVRETTSSSRPTSSSDIPLALQFPQLLQQQLLLQKQQQLQQQQLQQSGRHSNHPVRRANTHTSSSSSSQPPHPNMPTPLIDLTPKFQEAPQWSKEGRGHGVRPPPGAAHLVDLATSRSGPGGGGSSGGGASGRNSLVDEQPPSRAMLMRRDELPPHSAASHSSVRRTQTMTSASAAAAVGVSRSHRTVHHTPPVPLLARTTPGSATSRDDVVSSRERSGTLTRK
ncbi:hypothetical protein SPI_06155 [Niveomyces insectorum RCEF 264]|uniref:PH domain-containing protein n=1 Tax=Niveomyces insectorum RCEF 264 TaxID=1081102 RepID=A0A167RUK3_9HYPO|nr:hypothetical protein SPI_06155 [Niveomyces insectorum RCEF 264]